jgi:endonuclease/exonuclease/phosphatase (EEP) superfamily protein YafD
MELNLRKTFRTFLIAGSDLVFLLFFIWFALSMLTHGRFVLVNLMNIFAFEVFLSLIPFVVVGLIYNIRRLQIASLVALVLFAFLFAPYFLPKPKPVSASSAFLKVMTYNMLAFSPEPEAVVDVIRETDADIVFMQETNFAVANLLESTLKDVYPYQVHYPSDVPLGTSVISKYPFEPIEWDLGSMWVGMPIPLKVDWNGQKVIVLNFHMYPTSIGTALQPSVFKKVANARRITAQALLDFLLAHPGPAILAGDMNDTFLNDPYRMLVNAGLQDTWKEGGFGLGHTFPGNKSPGTSRPQIFSIYVPEWMVRIDYIFATSDWIVSSASMAPTDGYSDHCPVVAVLRLK